MIYGKRAEIKMRSSCDVCLLEKDRFFLFHENLEKIILEEDRSLLMVRTRYISCMQSDRERTEKIVQKSPSTLQAVTINIMVSFPNPKRNIVEVRENVCFACCTGDSRS